MSENQKLEGVFDSIKTKVPLLKQEIKKAIVGQEEVIHQLLISILAGGHSLFVGVPGLAKTSLINSLAEVMDLAFSRIQFTPDLMPSDIVGADILDEDAELKKRAFRFLKGPIFANIILADEINRSSPKTQSALLQAMQEYLVTVGGKTYPLEKPFLIFATQNPIEQEGTFPLPEAQLDRFLMQINVGYQPRQEEVEIVRQTTSKQDYELQHIVSKSELIDFQRLLLDLPISQEMVEYATDIVRKSRPEDESCPSFIKENIMYGAGPRGGQSLVLAAKANALLKGRFTVDAEDINEMLLPVLRHRLILSYRAEAENVSADDLITELRRRFA